VLPSAKEVRISGMAPLHFLQNLQYIRFSCSSYCNQKYDSSHVLLKRLPFLPTFGLDVADFIIF
jgi:hypothetical protein